MPSTVLRNAIVSPFPVKESFFVKQGSTTAKQERPSSSPRTLGGSEERQQVSFGVTKFLQELENAANNSAQLAISAPAHANSKGVAGTVAFDSVHGILYVCMATNVWWKFQGVAF